jgi:hypothetical protein
MINKITFCLADKPESFSFDFDYYTLLDDGSMVTNHGNLLFKSSNKKIFKALDFDMEAPTAFQIPQGTIGGVNIIHII